MAAWLRPVSIAVAVVALGLLAEQAAHSWDQPAWIPIFDLAIGWLLVACGLASIMTRPAQRAGGRLVVAGFLWFVGTFHGADDPIASSLGFAFGGYHDLVLIGLALAFPVRWPASRAARTLVGVTAALFAIQTVVRLVATLPGALGDQLVGPDLGLHVVAVVDVVRAAAVVASGMLAIGLLASSPPNRRRGVGLVLAAGAASAIASGANARFALTVLGFLPPWSDDVTVPVGWLINLVRLAVPIAMLVGILRAQAARTALVAAVRGVGSTPSSSALGKALATALGDPSLRLLTRDLADDRYIGGGGERLSVADLDALGTDPATSVAAVEVDGSRIAVLVVNRRIVDDELIAAGVALTSLVVQNERLVTRVNEQLLDVRASRVRIMEAADRERRRIERDLHDGLQQRMVGLALQLRSAEDEPTQRSDALRHGAEEVLGILQDVRELARGIHPAILTEAGLGPAIRAIADRSAVPVDLTLRLAESSGPAASATAYFVVSEALANLAKHGGATATGAWITAEDHDGWLRVVVDDDGSGGADPTGHGLGGLADRVAALDGRFSVGPRPGGGTRVQAEIPIR